MNSSYEVQPVIYGIESLEINGEERALFHYYPPTGFILFSRNIESSAQLKALCQDLKQYAKIILIDQEGGRVARLKPPVGQKAYPPAGHFGEQYQLNADEGLKACYDNYASITKELASYDIDSGCTPVLDMQYHNADKIIGDRSFGPHPDQIIALATKAIDAILDNGGVPIIKHIPGHGRAIVDSHYELPHIDTPIAELEQTDFLPFKQISSLYGDKIWAMTGHILFSQLNSRFPVTICKQVIDYIRHDIGFSGTLITDDIGMHAIHGELGQKKSLLEDAQKTLSKHETISKSQAEKIHKLFELDISGMSNSEIKSHLNKAATLINSYFMSNLGLTARASLEAGCDLVLHCSGNITEMEGIAFSLDNRA